MSYAHLVLDLRSYDAETQRHHHDYHQLVLPVSGTLEISIAGREGLVGPALGAVIPAGDDHAFAGSGDNRFIVADVPAPLAPELERLPSFIPLDTSLARYLAFLREELERPVPARHGHRQMLLLLIQLLCERFGGDLAIDRRVHAAQAWLDSHFADPVTLVQLATIANLSPRRLSDLFKRHFGMTPQQYLLERRMQEAWALLEGGNLSIQQVAERVGYGNIAAFSDRFRRHFGTAPSHLRPARD